MPSSPEHVLMEDMNVVTTGIATPSMTTTLAPATHELERQLRTLSKSHIALSLTVAAFQAGYTALYRSAFDWRRIWRKPMRPVRPELIRKLTRVDLLVFGDTAAAGALLDRFLHHAEINSFVSC
jgi:hypothetical protein